MRKNSSAICPHGSMMSPDACKKFHDNSSTLSRMGYKQCLVCHGDIHHSNLKEDGLCLWCGAKKKLQDELKT